MNWLFKSAQLYPYWLDGKTRCRIMRHVGAGRILVETHDKRVFEMFDSEFRRRATKSQSTEGAPQDRLCPFCGKLSANNVCTSCGKEVVD